MIPDVVRAGPTWIVATDAAVGRWTEALEAKGMQRIVPLPWASAHPVVDRAAVFDAVRRHAPDVVLLTSQEALKCLGPDPVPAWRAVCVGPAVLERAIALGFLVDRTAGFPIFSGRRLAEILLDGTAPRRCMLWLRGREAHTEMADLLRAGGVELHELVTYAVDERPTFARLVAEAPDPAAVLVGSPRGGAALVRALDRSGRRLADSVSLITLGDTTAQSLREAGFERHPILSLFHTFGLIDAGLASPE